MSVPKKSKMPLKMSEIQNANFTLPQGWRWVRLGEVLKEPLKNGLNYRKEDFGVGTKFVNVSDIFCPAVIDTSKLDRIKLSLKDVEKCQLEAGDILVVRSSLKREGVAYPALFIEDEEPVVFCGFLIRVRPDEKKIEPFYLLNYLRSSIARETLVGDSDTVTITNVDQGTLLSLSIPLSPLEEQRRIAKKVQELMQEMKRARTACEKQLEAANSLPASYLREVFESEEAKKWERRRLGDISDVIMGQSPPGCTYNIEGKGLPFYQGKIQFDRLYLKPPSTWCTEPKKIAKPNDILISVRAPVGPTNMCNVECCIGRGLAAISLNSISKSWFLLYYLRHIEPEIVVIGQGSTFSAISKSQIQNFEIPFPPIPVQQLISTELKEKMAEVEKLRTGIEKQLEAINGLPQAVLGKAFRGEL